MFKSKSSLLVAVALSLASAGAFAEPTGAAVKIRSLRPYIYDAGPVVYIYVSQLSAPCETDTYKLELSSPGGKEVYAAALGALLAGKYVRIEADGCTGWGSRVRSLFVDE
ncbi:hypothetical protein ACN9MU_15245 [Pseudoduganella sp. R-32]|uniref:hypothetical protein n=1 Tax=Pseudoduganella sp. R-32 TaxID=3404061 RepID=UPI003CF41667